MAAKSKTSSKRKKIGNILFSRIACSRTKSAARTSAKKLRESGRTARVIKNGSLYCTYAGPRRKKR